MKRLMYVGCTPGNDVKLLQNDLNAVRDLPDQKSSYDALDMDGAFGKRTLARVQEFQRANDLDADGVVGPKTLGVLTDLLGTIPGAQASQAPGGASPGGGKGYDGGPPYGKPVPSGSGKSTSSGSSGKGYGGGGGKSYGSGGGGKSYGSGGGGKSWGKG